MTETPEKQFRPPGNHAKLTGIPVVRKKKEPRPTADYANSDARKKKKKKKSVPRPTMPT